MEYSVLPHHNDHFKSQWKTFTCILYEYFLSGMLRTLVTLENSKIPFDMKWFELMFVTNIHYLFPNNQSQN